MSADPSYWLDHFVGDARLAALVVGGLTRRKCPWCERELRPCNMARHIAAAHFRQMTIDEMLDSLPAAYAAIEGEAAAERVWCDVLGRDLGLRAL